MRAFGAVRNAASFDHMAEQAEIDEVETHRRTPSLRITRTQLSNIADCAGKKEHYFRKIRKLASLSQI
jgi:hypothetical protein